jgi:sugar phosphate isomerase/epimerase
LLRAVRLPNGRWAFSDSLKGGFTQMLYGGMNFPIKPVLEEIEAIAELGFDYLELAMDPPQAHYKMINQQKDEILRALEGYKMGLVCHLPTFVSTADLTDSLRETSLNEVLESLQVAADLGTLKAVLHPSYLSGLSVLVVDQARDRAWRSLEAIVEKADQLGVSLCLENMFPLTNSLVEPEDFDPVFESFPSLKMTLDTGHAHMQSKGGKRALYFIKRFGNRIDHIHANDNFGKEDNHLPIGAGTVDCRKSTKALKEIRYNETITLEVFSRDRDYLRISREKIAAMFAAL